MIVKKRRISAREWREFQKQTLMDNAFMNLVLENNIPCTEEILRVILKKDDLFVKRVQTQKMLQGFGRSVCLDVYAEDSKGVKYNIEIQNADDGAVPRRARFHTGMIDAHSLKAGQDFSELPECYVIFITRNDVLGLNRTVYTIHKYIDEVLEPFDDGAHTVYVNCSAENDGSEIWKLIHDLQCPDAEEMYFPRLAERVGFLKGNDEEGGKKVMGYFDEREAKAVKAAEIRTQKKTQKKEKESIARTFLEMGKLTLEEIAIGTGLTLKAVQRLAETQ